MLKDRYAELARIMFAVDELQYENPDVVGGFALNVC